MNIVLRIFLIAALVIFSAIILRFLLKKKLNLKYTLTWLLTVVVLLVVVIFPGIVDFVGKLIGVATPVNTIFLFAGMFSILIILTLTIIVSHMNERIYTLVQTQAILEKRIRELENKENNINEVQK